MPEKLPEHRRQAPSYSRRVDCTRTRCALRNWRSCVLFDLCSSRARAVTRA
jgi:hypothetical protein